MSAGSVKGGRMPPEGTHAPRASVGSSQDAVNRLLMAAATSDAREQLQLKQEDEARESREYLVPGPNKTTFVIKQVPTNSIKIEKESPVKTTLLLPQHISNDAISGLLPTVPVPQSTIIGGGGNKIRVNGISAPTAPSKSTPAPTPSSNTPCSGEIVTSSVKELRTKGSSFLRTHASKHGITNASRKLTAAVVKELVQHYVEAHNVHMRLDDAASNPDPTTMRTLVQNSVAPPPAHQNVPPIGSLIPHPLPATLTIKPTSTPGVTVAKKTFTNNPKLAGVKSSTLTIVPTTSLPTAPHSVTVTALPINGSAAPVPVQRFITVNENAPLNPALPSLPKFPVPQAHLQSQQRKTTPVQMPTQPAVILPTKPLPVTAISGKMAKKATKVTLSTPYSVPASATVASTQVIYVTPSMPTVSVPAPTPAPTTSLAANQGVTIMQATTIPQPVLNPGNQAPCSAPILVKTRAELAACGTSLLRPEAASHKVHNASRKPKDKVIEELWLHYVEVHSKELASGKVGNGLTSGPRGGGVGPNRQRRQGNASQRRSHPPVKRAGASVANATAAGSVSSTPASRSVVTSGTENRSPGAASGWVGSVQDDEDNA